MPDPLLPLLELPGVRAAVDESREAVDRLRRHRVLRRRSAAVTAEAALHAARASAAIDGADYPLAEIRAGTVENPVLQGTLRVSGSLGGLAGTWRTAPLQVLARLHLLAASGQLDDARLGRPVPDPSGRLAALGRLVAGGTTAPAVIRAAIVHGELLSLAAFPAATGIVARAAARLTIAAAGLDPQSLTVPEVGHLAAGAEYAGALEAYATGTPDGVARWILHCCAATRHGAQEGLAICEAVQRG
jgi:hypothetical protein